MSRCALTDRHAQALVREEKTSLHPQLIRSSLADVLVPHVQTLHAGLPYLGIINVGFPLYGHGLDIL